MMSLLFSSFSPLMRQRGSGSTSGFPIGGSIGGSGSSQGQQQQPQFSPSSQQQLPPQLMQTSGPSQHPFPLGISGSPGSRLPISSRISFVISIIVSSLIVCSLSVPLIAPRQESWISWVSWMSHIFSQSSSRAQCTSLNSSLHGQQSQQPSSLSSDEQLQSLFLHFLQFDPAILGALTDGAGAGAVVYGGASSCSSSSHSSLQSSK